uniref:Uncharacterized protein n=1 Tax=Bos mutus grunniens TaxID=30521 RepID=A0A8B9Y1H0_BOSMU
MTNLDTGLNLEKVAALLQKLNSDAQFVLAQNVGTTHNLLDICLKRARVQGTQHVFSTPCTRTASPSLTRRVQGDAGSFLV